MQVKLLRLLETGTYRRVGSTELRHADIRVVSATHRDLHQMVAQGTFREDLYYRLSTFPILLPALRERLDDIVLLTESLLERLSPKRKISLTESALRLLQAQDFPGNVRELRNLLERSILICDGQILEASHIEKALLSSIKSRSTKQNTALIEQNGTQDLMLAKPVISTLKEAERSALAEMLANHQGSREELAKKLGISARSLYRKLKQLA